MPTLKHTLAQLEARLQALVEGGAARLFPGGRAPQDLGARLTAAMRAGVQSDEAGAALAPNLTVLLIGWSFLEGIGAVLIMPAIVGLVAGNFPPSGRPRAYGLIAAAAAIAIAVGPVIGGFMTTYFSWRYVFAGEVVIVIGILFLSRRAADEPVTERPHLDLIGAAVSAAGLALLVFGVLRSSTWGWVLPKGFWRVHWAA